MVQSADDTRQRLMEAAGEVFAAKGFQAATVRDICGRAEVNLAAVNYHFGDKERLYVEAVKQAHCSGHDEPPPDWTSETTPQVKLGDYIRRMLTRLLDPLRPAWHAKLMAREMIEPSETCLGVLEPYIRANHQMLDQILKELLPSDTSAVDRHLIGFSIIGQCLHFKIHKPIAAILVGDEELATYDVARLADHITRFSLAALGHEEPNHGVESRLPKVVEP